MIKRDIPKLKNALAEELSLLEQELKSVGRINPENPNDWEPSVSELVTETAELEARASEITDFEERSSIEYELEERYNEIKRALAQIETDAYGICNVCGEAIEDDRILANPAAATCKKHMI